MKIRVEIKESKEIDKLIKALENSYKIISVSKEYPNRPPSKASRVYIEVEEI